MESQDKHREKQHAPYLFHRGDGILLYSKPHLTHDICKSHTGCGALEVWDEGFAGNTALSTEIFSRHRFCRTHHKLVFTSINLPSYSPFCISGCFPVPVTAVQGADFIRICFVKCFSALYDAFALFLSVSAKPLKNAKVRALKVKTK